MKHPPFNKMQRRAFDFVMDRKGSATFMPPGGGKTRMWLEEIKETGGRTLVLAPKLVCVNTWPHERRKWGYERDFSMGFLHGKHKHLRNLPDVCLMNYDGIPWLVEELRGLRTFPFDQVIYDELSKLKNTTSKRFQEWDKIVDAFRIRTGGTGTPVGAHLVDLFGEMYVCDLGKSLGRDFDRWKAANFHTCPYTRKVEPYYGVKDDILDDIFDRAISFDINDLDMPPLVHMPLGLDLPPKVRAYYEEMHAESMVDDLDVTAVNAAVRQGKLRQLASGGIINDIKERRFLHDAKAERLREIADEFQGEPILIFFEFLSDYQTICRVLGHVPALYGGTTPKKANQYIRDWNAGKLPFFALHPRSASYGLNLQDSGRVLVWYTLSWSYELVNQGIARLWRQGQKNRVLSYYLLVNNTVDEDVFARVKGREELHNEIMMGLL